MPIGPADSSRDGPSRSASPVPQRPLKYEHLYRHDSNDGQDLADSPSQNMTQKQPELSKKVDTDTRLGALRSGQVPGRAHLAEEAGRGSTGVDDEVRA